MNVPHSPRWPRVVAEALAQVGRPLATVATTLQPASPADVLAAWQRARAPVLDEGTPPRLLLPAQHTAWRRVRAALAQWGGALLAEPVGTGKTWIALGIAAGEPGPVLVSGPAILRPQWHAAAERAGIAITWWSHERWSRRHLPPGDPRLIIVDEAHRFRDPTTRRLTTLAPWLSGRRALLLTATPIVNRVTDLVTLLRLILPEDALRLDGLAALGMLAQRDHPIPALARVVIRTAGTAPPQGRRDQALRPSAAESARGARAVAMIRTLTARHPAVTSRLLAAVLLDAAASSDTALRDALRRYRALLTHARDSGTADRQTLRRFAGVQLDQLVWWDLVGVPQGDARLPIDDLPLLEGVLTTFVPDDRAWLDGVLALIRGDVPTICFTRHRATAALLRTAVGDEAAWVTGDAAGIGPHRVPRDALLTAFGPDRATWSLRRTLPRVLIATDVAAEGLDLQAAGRLIHVDLPWTAVRMAQREGRLLRLGQEHASVAIVVRPASPPLEAALRRMLRVRRKQSLSARWLGPLALGVDAAACPTHGTPWAVVRQSAHLGMRDLVFVQLRDVASGRSGVMGVARHGDGPWEISHPTSDAWETIEQPCTGVLTVEAPGPVVESASRWALREAHRRGDWGPPRLIRRIHRLARVAAGHRDAGSVERLDRVLRWSTAAPCLGDRLRLDQIASASDAAVLACDAPHRAEVGPYEVRPVGVILFRSAPRPLR